jgi:hypothetical protein
MLLSRVTMTTWASRGGGRRTGLREPSAHGGWGHAGAGAGLPGGLPG